MHDTSIFALYIVFAMICAALLLAVLVGTLAYCERRARAARIAQLRNATLSRFEYGDSNPVFAPRQSVDR